MHHCSIRQTFELGKFFNIVGKSILNLVILKCEVSLQNIGTKCGKCGPVKLWMLYALYITCEEMLPLCRIVVTPFPTNAKVYKICKLHRTIFFTFYTRFWMLFSTMLMKFPDSKVCLIGQRPNSRAVASSIIGGADSHTFVFTNHKNN